MQKVRDVMSSPVHVLQPDETVQEAAHWMKMLDIGWLPVCDGDRPCGALTDRDIALRVLAERRTPRDARVGDVMHPGLVCVRDDQTLLQAAEEMSRHRLRRLPVVARSGRLVGIVSLGTLVRNLDPKISHLMIPAILRPPDPSP